MATTPPIPPNTANVSVSGVEDQPSISIPFTGTDIAPGVVVEFRVVLTLPQHGVLKDGNGVVLTIGSIVPATGPNAATIYFYPDSEWSGVTTFQYASRDDTQLQDASPATVTITVTPVNDPPQTYDTSASGLEDAASIAVVLKGSDIDGTVVKFTINDLPANGQLYSDAGLTHELTAGSTVPATAATATVYFVPDADWNGDTTFHYASQDNGQVVTPVSGPLDDATPALASIHVTPVNDPPETFNSEATGDEDTIIPVGLTGDDDDGTVVSFTISTLPDPAHGKLYADAAGTVELHIGDTVPATDESATVYFRPTAEWSGEADFDYASKDDAGLDDATPATAVITVEAVNDPPETADTSATGVEDAASIPVALTGSDIDGSVTSFTITNLPNPLTQGVLKDGNGNVLTDGSVIPATGNGATIYFTPVQNWNGDTTFNYASTDDDGLVDETPALGTIHVTPVNDAPESYDTSATGLEDAASIPVALTGTDPDGTVVSFTITNLPNPTTQGVLKDGNGNVLTDGSVIPATGNGATIYFTPVHDWNGDTTFNYASKDNEGLTDESPATGTIHVTPVNDAPETDNTAASGQEDTPVEIDLSGSDPDGTVVSFTITSLPANGTLKDGNGNVLHVGDTVPATNEGASVFFTPNANWNGDTTFTYASKDNEGLNDGTPATANIHIDPVNDAPESYNFTANGNEDGPPLNISLVGTDVDGTVVSFTINSLPANGVLKYNGVEVHSGDTIPASSNGATLTFTPNANWNGQTTFDYASKDNAGADDASPATVTINVASVNDAPETNNTAGSGVKGAVNIGLNLTGSDPDGTVQVFTITELPTNGVLKDGNGVTLGIGSTVPATGNSAEIFFTPTATFTGTVTFKYASKDNEGLSDSSPAVGTVVITPPISAPDPKPPETNNTSATGNEDSPGVPVNLSGSDQDGTVTSFTINSLPANGVLKLNGVTLTIGSVVPATGNAATVTFIPNANWNGDTSFNYASKDNSGLNDATPAKASIHINPVNDGPDTCDVCVTASGCSDQIKVGLAGSDPDGKVVSFKITTAPTDGVLKDASGHTLTVGSVVTANAYGQANVYFYPNSHWDGVTTFKYASVDNGGLQDATPATATIKIAHANDGPETASVNVTGIEDGGPVTVKITGTDSDGTVVSFKINSVPANGVLKFGTTVLHAGDTVTATGGAATLTFTPNANWNGVTSFQYSSKDNDGAYDSTPATGKITITGVNDGPSTNDVNASGCEDGGAVSICLSGTDPDGTVTSFTITDLPANGVLKNASGQILTVGSVVTASNNGATVYFTPNGEWSGVTSFHYAAKDNSGVSDATPNTAKITITGVNDAPTTNNTAATGVEDGAAVKITLSGADLDGTVTAFKITSLPANGVFKDAAGNTLAIGSLISASAGQAFVYFTPKANFSGETTFQYAAKDNEGAYDGSPATGKITITGVNDGPDAVNDSASMTANTALKLTSTTLLSNDTDLDGDKLTISSVQAASHGTVSLGADGVVTFTSTTGYTGAASFTYTVSDGHGGSDTATVSIDVKAASAPLPITGPGVRTQGFWGNQGSVYWDGETDASGVKHSPQYANFPKAELTYKVDTNCDGYADSNKYLLVGDFNKNGLTDNGEHTFLVGISDAKSLLSSATQDARAILGRDLITAWLNYLSDNPMGASSNTSAPAWFVKEAVDWLAQVSGTDKTLANGIFTYGAMSNGDFNGTDIATSSSGWQTGYNLDGVSGIQSVGKDVAAGSYLHTTLDTFNNTGMIGTTIWANDAG